MKYSKLAAKRAQIVIDLYVENCNGEKDNAVRDLLTDLRHYCDRKGLDFWAEETISYQNYLGEKE